MGRRFIFRRQLSRRGRLSRQDPETSSTYAVLAILSDCCPPPEGRLPTCYAPVRHFTRGVAPSFSFDLHVLGPPLTFALSQDQTLQLNLQTPAEAGAFVSAPSAKAADSTQIRFAVKRVFRKLSADCWDRGPTESPPATAAQPHRGPKTLPEHLSVGKRKSHRIRSDAPVPRTWSGNGASSRGLTCPTKTPMVRY